MIEIAAAVLLGAVALLVVLLANPITAWIEGAAAHRQAQADSVLKHAGLIELEHDADEDSDG